MRYHVLVGPAVAYVLLSSAAPAQASNDLFGNDQRVRVPQIATAAADSVADHVVFAARPSSTFGHSYVVVGATTARGYRHRTVILGFYPATGADDVLSVLAGTWGGVGNTSLDIRPPTVAFRLAISQAERRKLQRWTRQMRVSWRHFDLVRRNRNHLVGRVARSMGLVVRADGAQSPEAFVRALDALNAERAGRIAR